MVGNMAQLVNAVGGGDLGAEVDLHEVSKEISLPGLSYEPEVYPGLCFKFEEGGGTVMLFTSGKYNVAGANSIEELWEIHYNLIDLIESLLKQELNSAHEHFEVRNLVYLDKYHQELDLSELCVVLGLQGAEYEPEIHPSLQYKPAGSPGVFLIFRNGKILMTGAADPDEAQRAFNCLFDELDELLAEAE